LRISVEIIRSNILLVVPSMMSYLSLSLLLIPLFNPFDIFLYFFFILPNRYKMSSSSSTTTTKSESLVSATLTRGLETSLTYVAAGFVVGGLSAVVLRGRSGTFRKAVAGLGAGVGMGCGWAKTSMEIEGLWK